MVNSLSHEGPPCLAVHVAFYLWYGTPTVDKKWLHWNHPTLPHWTEKMNKKYPPNKPFTPPDEPHSPYYPERACLEKSSIFIRTLA